MVINCIDPLIILILCWVIFSVTKDQNHFLEEQAGAGIWAFLGIIYALIRLIWLGLHWAIPIIKETIYQFNQLSGR